MEISLEFVLALIVILNLIYIVGSMVSFFIIWKALQEVSAKAYYTDHTPYYMQAWINETWNSRARLRVLMRPTVENAQAAWDLALSSLKTAKKDCRLAELAAV